MVGVEVAEGVYWVGAIDWNVRDFHGYTTSRGTTYNAYLIVDEKVALVDTVKDGFSEEMFLRICEIVDPEKIDYVVSNHSGSVYAIMECADEAKLVSTSQGKDGLTKYYGGDWPFVTVKTGDMISLGKKSLTFVEARMLHWPDSMFTYIREQGLLLPNDAFGQHLATSQRFDDEVDNHVLMDEAAKYYANILMPLAPLILKKVDEVKKMGITIDIIAPSHGVIWRREPGQIVDAYVRWSQGQSKDKIIVIYDTMWGSTEIMAKAILEGIIRRGVETRLFHLRRSDRTEVVKEVLDSKAILIGSPTINNCMFPTGGGFLTYLKGLRPRGKLGAAFGSYGWGGGAVRGVYKELKETGFEVVEPGLEVKFAPNEDEIERCIEFGEEVSRRVIGG